jgi:hypothetical protein
MKEKQEMSKRAFFILTVLYLFFEYLEFEAQLVKMLSTLFSSERKMNENRLRELG